MAIRTWQGQADAIAQISEAQITTHDAATTYALLLGGDIIASAIGATVADVTSALLAAWNASTHPYKTNLTASVPASDTVRITSTDPGMPFLLTTSATAGTGAWGAVTDVTAVSSPNDWSNPGNWAEGAVPVSADDPVFRDGGVDVRWGLDQAAVLLDALTIEKSYTGKIGLSRTAVMIDATGATDATKPEYRPQYLRIGWARCDIGEVLGPGSPPGSTRLKLDNAAVAASTTVIHDGSSASEDGELPAIRLLMNHASARVEVREAPGGVGVGVDGPSEVALLDRVDITDPTPATRVSIGAGVSVPNWRQLGGVHQLKSAINLSQVQVLGGELTIEGTVLVTALQMTDGVCRAHNKPATGSAITDAQIDGGTLDGSRSQEPRIWSQISLNQPGATVRGDSQVVTITSLKEPLGPFGITAV